MTAARRRVWVCRVRVVSDAHLPRRTRKVVCPSPLVGSRAPFWQSWRRGRKKLSPSKKIDQYLTPLVFRESIS